MDQPFPILEVQKTCQSMPNGMACGHDGLSYESLRHGTTTLYKHLTFLFNSMVKHAYMPPDLKTSVVIPLHKGKGKPKDEVNH